jgi:hypothetical protein
MATTAIDDLEASIQSQIGDLLTSRQELNTIAASSILDLASQATTLLITQTDLENRLPGIMDIVNKVKTDAYTMSDISTAGTFYADMLAHLSNVDTLEQSYLDKGGTINTSANMNSLLLIGIAFGFFYFYKNKR